MAESLLKDISDTAVWIAAYRAMESEKRKPLFHDPYAKLLVGKQGQELAKNIGLTAGVYWSVVIRTCVIDEFISEALQRGVRTVLNLGAGLDTRPYRMNLSKDIDWIEIDFPHVLDFKEAVLRDKEPTCHLSRLKMDLANAPLRRKVFSEINSEESDVLILSEGVIPYMSTAVAGELARDLSACPKFQFWVTDYFSPEFMAMQRQSQLQKILKSTPFQFFPTDWEAHYSSNGWQLSDMRYLADEGRKRKRPAPTPWRTRLHMAMGHGPNPDVLRRMLGYALLTRAPRHGGINGNQIAKPNSRLLNR